MSDIQFLINLIINYNLTEDAKNLCLKRIGEIEERNAKPQPMYTLPREVLPNPIQPQISQAQLRDMQAAPTVPPAQLQALKAQGEVITGGTSGTSIRGPNKMRGRL